MRFDDDAPDTPSDAAAADAPRARRRSARPWSNPDPVTDRPTFERPISDADWAAPPALTRTRPPIAPPVLPTTAAPAPAPVDLGPVLDQLRAMQSQITALQAAVTVPPAPVDASLVTGDELAASIEALGSTLGGGMATLLTEHRNLLARDVSTAADRILEEVGVRLRAAATQTIDGVEERVRHVVSRSLAELSEQVELRLDKVAADVSGLRAVMLEIPDQAAVTDRLDVLAESVAGLRTKDGGGTARMSPALAGAIEKTVAGSMEQLEESVHSVVEVVRELLDERLPEDLAGAVDLGDSGPSGAGVDGDAIAALTAEMKALRRRISLRSGAGGDVDLDALAERVAPLLVDPPARGATDDDDDDDEDDDADDDLAIEIEAPPAPPKPARAKATTKATTKAAPKEPAPPARGRRSRRIT